MANSSILYHLATFKGISNSNNFDHKLVRSIYNKHPFRFSDIVEYIFSFYPNYDKHIFTIIELIMASGINLLPKRPLLKILAICENYISKILYVQDLIIYIIECDLDFLTYKVISKILESLNGITLYFSSNQSLFEEVPKKNLCNIVVNSCDIKRYLKYLETYESKGLTSWCKDTPTYIWIHQLEIIARFSHNIEIFNIIFNIILILLKNCEDLYYSPKSIRIICDIVIEYGKCFDNYDDLYQIIWNTKIHLLLKNKMKDYIFKPSEGLKMCMGKLNSVHKRKRIISTIFSIEKVSRNFPKDIIRHICINYDS